MKEAIRGLLASGRADRVGVWMETTGHGIADSEPSGTFRGMVAEKDGEETPAEWSRLLPQAPLPADLLANLKTVEQDVDDSSGAPMIGALIEMRRVLWVPLQIHAQLRGVLLAASRRKQARLPRALAESVVAELSSALELEEERHLARKRYHVSHHMLTAVGRSKSPSEVLAAIVRACTDKDIQEIESSAVFAAIGCLAEAPETKQTSIHSSAKKMRFGWPSGAAAWIRALESDEVSGVWRRALESHGVVGSEPGNASPSREVGRVVAWPVEAAGETLGVLVAGIRRGAASLAALEQLQLGAALAGAPMLQLKRAEEAADHELREKEVVVALAKQPDGSKQADAVDRTDLLNVIEWLEEGVVLFGPTQEIRALNSRFGQMVGLAPDELARVKTINDLVTVLAARTADGASLGQEWLRSDQTQGPVREELHLVRPIPRLLERAARPLLDKNGVFVGHLEIYRDLTAQRVFQSKLLQTEKLAELGQMVTGVAHELSNPLTSILGYAQRLLLRRDGIGDSQEARQIFQEAERASTILRQLLLSARDSRPERRRVALNQVATRTQPAIFLSSSTWTRCSHSCRATPGSSSKCS